ncbi:MAG: hypothetical protein JWL77_2891 [Chthonomonadaceae bacterium]|nr:hypothetical protein [Chthonomonadaceae bacterium]
MRINRPTVDFDSSSFLSDRAVDNLSKVFQLSLIPTILLTAWLMWGLFSGRLADVAGMSHADHAAALQTIATLSTWLNVSLLVTVVSAGLIYMEMESLGVIYLLTAAFLAFGLKFIMTALFTGESARLMAGDASTASLKEIQMMAYIIGVPGVLLAVKTLLGKIFNSRHRDLTNLSFGKDAARTERKAPLIGALAKCWELPFCREGIRVRCPIFHAKTKCWKERVGCMCEENIILLAMGGNGEQDPEKTQPLNKQSGFIPIGDLLSKNAEEKKAAIPTRLGPRGVRIPTNPHLSEAQKRQRCHNCVIFNEHQRQKYQFLSAPVTLAVPLLVVLQFDNLRQLIDQVLGILDKLIGQVSFHAVDTANLSKEISGNLGIEVIFIVCITLVLMTWAQRLLEYTMFKIKI